MNLPLKYLLKISLFRYTHLYELYIFIKDSWINNSSMLILIRPKRLFLRTAKLIQLAHAFLDHIKHSRYMK